MVGLLRRRTVLNMLACGGCRGKHRCASQIVTQWFHVHREFGFSPQERQDITNDNPQTDGTSDEQLSDGQIQSLIADAFPDDLGLTPMSGFNLNLSANADFRKLFFSATCDCGTSALLSVEISNDKTVDEIRAALPSVIEGLSGQAKQFQSMSCDLHTKMRLGPTAQ